MSTKRKLLACTGVLAVVIGLFVQAQGQDPIATGAEGNNAVWNALLGEIYPSTAYIDVTPFYNNLSPNFDICIAINNILTASTYPATGSVIDARGIIAPSGSLPLTCSINPFKGTGGATTVAVPSTVLLPAATIAIQATWQLPSNTRIVGEGPNSVTQLQIVNSSIASFTGSTMIAMCPATATTACNGISVEHVRLTAQDDSITPNNYAVDGIDNNYAQDGSYIDDVFMYYFGAMSNFRAHQFG